MSADSHRADAELREPAATIPEAEVQSPGSESTEVEDTGPDSSALTADKDRGLPRSDATSDSAALEESTETGSAGLPPPKRSPTEAFAELSEGVHLLRADIDDIGSFVRVCRDKLLRQADEYRFEGMHAVLESLMRLHSLVYRQVTMMECGNAKPDAFVLNLFATLEAELKTHGIEVVRPQPGEEVNLEVMTTIGTMHCPFWRKPDRVAQINTCGFVRSTESERRILRKAEITVFRRQ